MLGILSDFRFAARSLASRRGFTAAAVLTLTLGIGMTTAIFAIVNAVVLQPLPLPHARRIVSLCELHAGATPDWCSIAPPNVEDIAARSKTLDALGIARSWSATLSTPQGEDNLYAGIATPGALQALGFRVEMGRLLEKADVTGRAGSVALLSHATWQARFGSDPAILDRTIMLDGEPVRIVGVLAPGAVAPPFGEFQLWRPVHIDPASEQHRTWPGFVSYGRLREGVSLTAARAELATITRAIRDAHFANAPTWDVLLTPTQLLVTGGVRGPMLMFFGAVVLVLLIACANVANLILSRAATRSRELAVRSAMGASRGRIARALLAESTLLAAAGSALGILLAVWIAAAFKALAPAGIPRIDDVRTSPVVIAFAVVLALGTVLVFGVVPALRASRVDLSETLRNGDRGASGSARLGRILVVAELAIALPLVAGTALLGRSFAAITSWQPGFEREHLATFTLFLPRSAYASREAIAREWQRLEGEVASIPGVVAVATASAGPLFGSRETSDLYEEGQDTARTTNIRWYDVSPSYFATLGVPVVRGRNFDTEDRWGAPRNALVNETLVRRLWPGQDPIGKRLVFPAGTERETFTVVGVVRDIPSVTPGTPVQPQIFWSNRQAPRPFTYFVVRTTVPPHRIADAVKARITAVDRNYSVESFKTYAELMAGVVRSPRFNMLLIATFGLAAIVLAGIGTYGLISYVVTQRTREMGIRLALGARPAQILRDVVTGGLRLAVIGSVLGVAGAVLLTKVIAGFVSGVSARDPWVMVAAVAVVVGTASVACLLPALRASRVDPSVSLLAQ